MKLYDAAIPAVLADVAVLLSFFDGLIIDSKVQAEIGVPFVPQRTASEHVAALGAELQAELGTASTIDQAHKDRVTRLINKTQDEIKNIPASLTHDQRTRIVQMCNGASTMLGWFTNMMIIFANAILAEQAVPQGLNRPILTTLSIIFVLAVYHVAHVAARGRLSAIDYQPIWRGWKLGTILRIELFLLNIAVFVELASGISFNV